MAEQLAGGKLLLDHPAEAVARLTLNRPDARNALDHETLNGIAEAMPTLDKGIEVSCVILTGAGGIFSAGRCSARSTATPSAVLSSSPSAAICVSVLGAPSSACPRRSSA